MSDDLQHAYQEWASEALSRWLPRSAPNYQASLNWVLGRFTEGRAIACLLRDRLARGRLRVLDLGAGNGGVSLGVASEPDFSVIACDCYLNSEVLELRQRMSSSFCYCVGRGEALPFAGASFDVVLLVDVIEHVADPSAIGREAARVLGPGGVLVLTTPPRLRFLLRGDPHHGIIGLAWLPAWAQKLVAEKVLRRTDRYDVRHLYWSAWGLRRKLPSGFRIALLGGQRQLRSLGLDWDRILCVRTESGRCGE